MTVRTLSTAVVLSKAKEWLTEQSNMESQSTDSPEAETSTEGGDPKRPRVEEVHSQLDDLYASVLCPETEPATAKGNSEGIKSYLR
uniref:Uncharacterized protein n=1 Tax=Anguilla anguilla TaxID=7936 RepID=A0A0E9Y080_ANGAN